MRFFFHSSVRVVAMGPVEMTNMILMTWNGVQQMRKQAMTATAKNERKLDPSQAKFIHF